MPRVMFTISYGIKPEKRDEYLLHVAKLKAQFSGVEKKDYAIFEVKGKPNQFTEVFVAGSVEEFDALEDYRDPATEPMVRALEEYLDSSGMKYTTLVETV